MVVTVRWTPDVRAALDDTFRVLKSIIMIKWLNSLICATEEELKVAIEQLTICCDKVFESELWI